MQERTWLAYLLIAAILVAAVVLIAVFRAKTLEGRAIRRGQDAVRARRRYRWWSRGR
ncbi:hypothetical protein [Stakelama saccharophila]|uniref:Uncharacterized protein n=1 Tax=Stakelama saccharophila TaxID=3075605 RepID=A0ABZ0BB96_9SPHN|nr:hypothetical protein [Stakelama sp. W311]WNO54628.1 hypothetical protein RPR59_05085 [Stakelama sp. W311]